MGIGNNNPQEMLDVSGAIKIGTDLTNTTGAPTGGAGTVRFRSGIFEGWDGSAWIPLGGGSSADSDWTVSGANQYSAVTGNVGIGITLPATRLHAGNTTNGTIGTFETTATGWGGLEVKTGSGAASYVLMNDGTNSAVVKQFGGLMQFEAPDNVIRMAIQSSDGNVGIGTTTPNYKLDVNGSARFSNGSFVNNGLAANPSISFSSDSNTGIYTPSADNLGFVTGGVESFRVDENGNVGIGPVNPDANLDLVGSFRYTDGNQGANKVLRSDGSGFATWVDPATLVSNDADWTISGNNQYSAVSGNVGIGTASPTVKLEVAGNFIVGVGNTATGLYASSFGVSNNSNGFYSLTAGQLNNANGNYSVAMGRQTTATGAYSISMGRLTTAGGTDATAFGNQTNASGDNSFASGRSTIASGVYSTATGQGTTASGVVSTAMGTNTLAKSYAETALGLFNTDYSPSSTGAFSSSDRLLVVGNGANSLNRSDALVILKNGNTGIGTSTPSSMLEVAGQVKITGGTPGANKVLTSDAAGLASWVDPTTLISNDGDWTVIGSNQYSAVSGNVGIGITNPTHKLHVTGGSNTAQIGNGEVGTLPSLPQWTYFGHADLDHSAAVNHAISQRNSGATIVNAAAGQSVGFRIAGAEKMTVAATGNVGIGVTNPAHSLQVAGSNSAQIGNGEVGTSSSLPQWTYFGHADLDHSTFANHAISQRNSGATIVNASAGQTLGFRIGMIEQMTLSSAGNFGIGNNNPTAKLEVTGQVKITGGTPGANKVLTSDATGLGSWVDPATLVANAGFTTTAGVTSNAPGTYASDDFVFGSAQLDDDDTTPNDNARFFFDKSKAAFRAGFVPADEWDAANVGNYSTAFGQEPVASGSSSVALGAFTVASGSSSIAAGLGNTASGNNSVAMGSGTSASGIASTAIGFETDASGTFSFAGGENSEASGVLSIALGESTIASGPASIAIGSQTTASGDYSAAIGLRISAKSYGEMVVGRWNTDYTPNSTTGWNASDRLFVVGNGTASTSRSDAMVVLKNGNTGIGTSTPTAKLDIAGTAALNNNQLRLKDGSDANHYLSYIGGSFDGAKLTGFNNVILNTVSGGDALIVTGNRVGIGTTAPIAPLHVEAQSSPTYGNFTYYAFQTNAGGGSCCAGTVNNVSIHASGRVMASEFDAFSDARIKSVISVSNSEEDLKKLLGIKITDYRMKDAAKDVKQYKKVIAQQVEEVYPEAVSQITDVIPNIYSLADIENGFVSLKADVKTGDRIKLILESGTEMVTVTKVEENGFVIDSELNEQAFVYGTEVDDFRTVDYEAISMLNVSATQELFKLVSQLQSSNKELEQKLSDYSSLKADVELLKEALGIDLQSSK